MAPNAHSLSGFLPPPRSRAGRRLNTMKSRSIKEHDRGGGAGAHLSDTSVNTTLRWRPPLIDSASFMTRSIAFDQGAGCKPDVDPSSSLLRFCFRMSIKTRETHKIKNKMVFHQELCFNSRKSSPNIRSSVWATPQLQLWRMILVCRG